MTTLTCPVCARVKTPTHRGLRGQTCCSLKCSAIYRHRRHPEESAKRVQAMRTAQRAQRRVKEQRLVNGCRTLVEAFRAGQKYERKRWEAIERYQRERAA